MMLFNKIAYNKNRMSVTMTKISVRVIAPAVDASGNLINWPIMIEKSVVIKKSLTMFICGQQRIRTSDLYGVIVAL